MSDEFNLEEENFNENNLELDETEVDADDLPSEVRKLNWGAFLWPFIWGLFNVKFTRVLAIIAVNLIIFAPVIFMAFSGMNGDPSNTPLVMLSVVLLISSPIVNLIIMIIFLVKGNRWSWQDKNWESVEHFVAVQKKWTMGMFIFSLISMILSAVIPIIIGASVFSFISQNMPALSQQNAGQATSAESDFGSFGDESYSANNLPDVSQDWNNTPSAAVGANNSDSAPSAAPAAKKQTAPDEPVGAARKPINNKDIIDNSDKVVITIGGHGRENPFKPFYDQAFSGDFPPPDDVFNIDESAKKLMSIKVTGILFDPYKPTNASAIVNASGSDYMVKKGDVVAGFSILDINKNRVYVKFGSNTYNAGIGETIHAELKDNSGLDNIDKKFAGNTR